MPPRANGSRLLDEVEHFEERVRATAFAIADALIRQELQRRLDAVRLDLAPTPRRRIGRASRSAARVVKVTEPNAPPKSQEVSVRGRKQAWTRGSIVNELAGWLISGTTIDAAFVTRHGPPGLVAATRKIFGRFDAALNVAGLEVAKRYPDGPPARRAT